VAERVLTTRDLNRALLARQLLLERASLPLGSALEQVAGLQTQYAPSGYVGLWSRLKDFPRLALTRALHQREAVQGTLMRSTIHTVSSRDYWLFTAGIRRGRQEWWQRVVSHQAEGLDIEKAAALFRRHLKAGPKRANDLKELLAQHGIPAIAWNGVGLWVDLVRVPPSGTWEARRADLYGLAETWLNKPAVTEAEGLEHLVRRYLAGYGPAPLNDIAAWAGLNATRLRPALTRLQLRSFRSEQGIQLFDLPRAPLPDPNTPAPVRFLPTWDSTLLAHCRRTQILPEAYRPLVFNTKTPQSVATFLVDGAVAGIWRFESGRINLSPFDTLSGSARRDLEEEAARLAAFHTL
jgi:hypothetical protein